MFLKIPATCVQDARIGYIQDVLVFQTLQIIVEPMAGSVSPERPQPHTPSPPPSLAHTSTMSDKVFNILQWNANGIGNNQTELSFFLLLLLFSFRDLWKEWGDSNFQIFFYTELPVPPQAAGVVGTFNVLDIYPSEHYGLSFFWTLRMPFFTRSPFFCIHFHFASTLCMCVMYLTSI